MKHVYALLLFFLPLAVSSVHAQSCTPQGDQTTYGTNNTWIGYAYQGQNFTTYKGYVTEGSSVSPNFDENFGGASVSYNTNGCQISTDDFAMRYKLKKNFTSGTYQFTVGGDDGYRLSLDGGATWVINNWALHSYTSTTYTVALSGNVNMVLEYYENSGDNRVSFNLILLCSATGDPSVYGTNNTWNGFLYQGMNFDTYKGQTTEGNSSNPNFDENFNNPSNANNVTYNTTSCYITTYQFSARYRLTQTLPLAHYVFTVGGDDGFRFSLDGGSTWVINKWNDQSYTTASYTANISGTFNMVIEFYDNGGASRLSFSMTSSALPVTLTSWTATAASSGQALLKWSTTNAVNFDHYTIQRSTDGTSFQDINTIHGNASPSVTNNYSYTDHIVWNGTVYYRLAMVDLDGTINYSNIVSVDLTSPKNLRIYPTMVDNGSVFVESSQSLSAVSFELYDMSGNKISQKNWSVLQGRQQISLPISTAGAYIARLSDRTGLLSKQIIIIK